MKLVWQNNYSDGKVKSDRVAGHEKSIDYICEIKIVKNKTNKVCL
jgi:hypothetical protein